MKRYVVGGGNLKIDIHMYTVNIGSDLVVSVIKFVEKYNSMKSFQWSILINR